MIARTLALVISPGPMREFFERYFPAGKPTVEASARR